MSWCIPSPPPAAPDADETDPDMDAEADLDGMQMGVYRCGARARLSTLRPSKKADRDALDEQFHDAVCLGSRPCDRIRMNRLSVRQHEVDACCRTH